jgi:methyl-accepting chemotaxis protein
MNIRNKLYLLAGIPLGGLLVVFLVSLFVITGLRQAADEINTTGFRALALVGDLVERFESQKALISRTAAEIDLQKVAQNRTNFEAKGAEIDRLVEDFIKTSPSSEVTSKLKSTLDDFRAYRKEAPAVFKAAESFAQETALNALNGPVATAEKKVQGSIAEIDKLTQDNADKKIAEIDSSTARSLTTMVVIAILLVVGSAGAAYTISTSIVSPLNGLQSLIGAVQVSGDLSKRAQINSNDEVGTTSKSFNELMGSLQSALKNIHDSVDKVNTAAETVSMSSAQVAEISSSQSQSAGAMASTVEQMTESIKQIADGAKEALEISKTSGELSGKGGTIHAAAGKMTELAELVKQTSSSIQELGHHSDQISSIVQVIKDVAEQTNLLALNAAIEAARAGEQGRGFAVVADEVRKLAERTAQATQQIYNMIALIQNGTHSAIASMELVTNHANEGVSLAVQAGDVVTKIYEGSTQAIVLANHISSALAEQTAASNHISEQVEMVSRRSEENDAAANETDKAAKRLTELAVVMQNAVGQFKI